MSDCLHRAMEAIAESMRALEQLLITSRNLDPIERAAGYRFILGVNKWVTDRHFLGGDVLRPRFIKFMDEFSQWGMGNPDNCYWSAQIEGGGEYLVTGRRGTITDICIELRTGIGRREDGEHSRTLAYVDSDGLAVDDDGLFRVSIGGPEQPRNWLPCPDEAELLFVRQTFGDWDREEPERIWIERTDVDPPPAPPADPEHVARQMEDIARRLNFIIRINDEQIGEFRERLLTNAFPMPKEGSLAIKSKGGFFPGQHNALAWWSLPEGKAIIISIRPPECRYLGLMIGHPIWFSALDFENRQNSLNLQQAYVSGDGMVHYVIAAADPAIDNWIDPGHLREGFIFFRCQGLTGEFHTPVVRVVDIDRLAAELPADLPHVDAAERRARLRRRRLAVQRRFL